MECTQLCKCSSRCLNRGLKEDAPESVTLDEEGEEEDLDDEEMDRNVFDVFNGSNVEEDPDDDENDVISDIIDFMEEEDGNIFDLMNDFEYK